MFGINILGEANNIILGDENPVLIRKFRGRLKVTVAGAPIYWKIYNGASPTEAHYGYCQVTYPEVITDPHPPFVFATPSSAAKGAMGLFAHTGAPGAWTGFSVLYIPVMTYQNGKRPAVGTDTGWDYHVCKFGDAPSNERWGMRVWNSVGKLTFDSSWDVVPFRSLLTGWTKISGGKYGGGNINANHYWGNSVYNGYKDSDVAYEVYSHPWGVENGTLGVMISSLSALRCTADVGYSDDYQFTTAPMVGFLGADRKTINASVCFGHLQHASTVYPAMNSFALMTADFAHSTA